MSRYPYIDRNPCIVAAGKPPGGIDENVKDLFFNVSLDDKIEAIRKQFGFIDVKDYGAEWAKPPDLDACGAALEIKQCMRRPLLTTFQTIEEEIKNTIYDSYWNKPLGKCRDPTPGLPLGMDPLGVTFGKPSEPHDPAGAIINPPKRAEQVEYEERVFHDLYAFSHNNHYPGEQIKRGYSSEFSEYNYFGTPSKKNESGDRIKRCLTWFNNDPLSNVSRRLAAVRNRTLPPLGKALDKTGVTELFPPNHTYGMPSPTNFYRVEDLLNDSKPSLVRRDMLTFLAYANKLREIIHNKINSGDIALKDIYDEVASLEKNRDDNKSPTVNMECIDRILRRHGICLDRSKLDPLLVILGLIHDEGVINLKDFIDFIDKNKRFPELKKEHYILPPEFQDNSNQPKFEGHTDKKIHLMRAAGIPSVRIDKSYPTFWESMVNMDHMGEETNARALISPSIYTQYGLSHRDFFQPRSKEFLGNLFEKIGVSLSEEELEEIYKEGLDMDQTGGVCVETFRNILDERAYKAYSRL